MYRICTYILIIVQIMYNVNMKNTIGKQLKDLRKELGLTQMEVANSLKISRVNYTRYETDAVCPDFDTLIDIADFYNVPLDYLFNRIVKN